MRVQRMPIKGILLEGQGIISSGGWAQESAHNVGKILAFERKYAYFGMGLEKYVMTKLFSRTFAASPEDAKADQEISEKISLLQNFLRPEHLDIPAVLQNEASWLVFNLLDRLSLG
ncbi:Vacuolar protein sorting-associated protein 9A [Vitis vinifera]|uniref:Vacuolar protein sorting-associated protein 9A n=1 Tax=Vitis vinifera TaxID=29760 RepID=A0A438CA06_VITVI|nr:Vacuolar protein sorting-associated protein 9A [Vitis vinifera]